MRKVKWGILGTSYISEVMAQAIQRSTTSELIAIAGRSQVKTQVIADRFSIPQSYTDYQVLLNEANIDAVYIGLPNHLHKEWIIRAAYAKINVLCEKPLVLNTEEALSAFAAVEKANVFCMEALMYRYHPLTKKLNDIIQSHVLGDIKLFNATYTANIAALANPTAGGSIRNLGCYPVSLVRLLTGTEPIEIVALKRINQQSLNDHQASAILKFANHTMAVISTADDLEMFWQFDLYGTNGTLKMLTNPWLPAENNKIELQIHGESTPREINVLAEKPLYTYQIDVMNNKILNTLEMMDEGMSWQDSLGNVSVLENWQQCSETSC